MSEPGTLPPDEADTASRSARATRVRLMVFDVDGVLTDGRLHYGPQGEALKTFHVRDGHGIKLLQRAGVRCALLSARRSEIVAVRARELGIDTVIQGAGDKLAALGELCAAQGIGPEDCGFMGDDWPDLPVLRAVGFAASVADATPEARAAAHWISSRNGGHGAVRELAEYLLRAQGRLEALLGSDGGTRGDA